MIATLKALRDKRAPAQLPAPAARQRIRKSYGVSQSDMASVLGVSRLTVSMWERGQTDPTPEHARRYAELLDQMDRENQSRREQS